MSVIRILMLRLKSYLPKGRFSSTRNIKNWGRSGLRKLYHAFAFVTVDKNVARSPKLFILRDRYK